VRLNRALPEDIAEVAVIAGVSLPSAAFSRQPPESASTSIPDLSAALTDIFALYEIGMAQLLERIDKEHPRYAAGLTFQARLLENVAQARTYGDSENLRSERNRILTQLNRLALDALKVSFNELCGPATNTGKVLPILPPDLPREVCSVAPLGTDLPVQEPPSSLSLPAGYLYLGQPDGLTTDHFYREQDGHVALYFPALPGVSQPFLIDKYAITAQQFSRCLNDLLDRRLVQVEPHPKTGIQCCIDSRGRPLAFDALHSWQRGPIPGASWLHTAIPWGITYRDEEWHPVSGNELLPVTLVTWWGARLYSLWARRRLVDLSNEEAVYLPTIQQWRTAALWDVAARRQRRYPWGDTWRREWVNYAGYWADREILRADWERLWASRPDAHRRTRPLPVADLSDGHSPIGCVQVLGNVWEWCADRPADSHPSSRAIKGGACFSAQEHCSPDWTGTWARGQGYEYIGFRCCSPLVE
jgi:formylglycine-generating enzyme required for sulfatase activity